MDYLERGNISYVLPAHSEMLILPMEYLLERKEQWTMELINYGLLELLKLRNLNDKNVLWVWGMNINIMVVGCYITHLILILLVNIGGGGRIWTFDLRVMSPTSYLTAPPRYWKLEIVGFNFGARDRFRTGDPQLGRLMLYRLSYSRFPNYINNLWLSLTVKFVPKWMRYIVIIALFWSLSAI